MSGLEGSGVGKGGGGWGGVGWGDSHHRGSGCPAQGGAALRVTPSMPAGGLGARGHPSLAPSSLGDPALATVGGAPSHLPDSGRIFLLILPKLAHSPLAPGLASCRALGCHLSVSFSHAAVGSTLLKCKCGHVTRLLKIRLQGRFKVLCLAFKAWHSQQPPLHPLPAPQPQQIFRIPLCHCTSCSFSHKRPCYLLCFTQNTPTHTARHSSEAPPPRSLS